MDPSATTYINLGSDRTPLKAASTRFQIKKGHHTSAMDQASAQGITLQFDQLPLVFESTGAFGTETQSWFSQMVKTSKDLGQRSLALSGAPHTWPANAFSSFWSQRLSLVQAMHQAESMQKAIQDSLPRNLVYSALDDYG